MISCFTFDPTEFDRVRTRCYTDGTESLMTFLSLSTLLDAVPFIGWLKTNIYTLYISNLAKAAKGWKTIGWVFKAVIFFSLVFLNVFLTFRLRLAILDLASELSADWTFSYAYTMIFYFLYTMNFFSLFCNLFRQFLQTKKENSSSIHFMQRSLIIFH